MGALPVLFRPSVTLLRLGRVSNLPTVWTNVAAATLLAGGALFSATTLLAIGAMSLWAGESVGAVKRVQPAAEIVRELVEETEQSRESVMAASS